MREVTDDLGRVITVPTDPRRLVSLVPSLSETLWWWHLADRLIAVTDYCVAPPSAFGDAVRVRGTKNPDVDRIVGLEPELVIANEEENRHRDVELLEAAGIAVYVTCVRTIRGAADTLARLGEVLGRPAAGLGLRQSLLRALDQARLPEVKLRCVCPIWRDGEHRGSAERWWLVGGDTFAGDLLARSGFEPALAEVATARYPRHRLDELAQADPDVVLLPDEPYAFDRKDAEVFASWRARVRYLDGTALSWWGPRTPDAIGDLARLARQLAGRRSPSSTGASRADTMGATTDLTR
ncbi:MAG: helical backbone metal receptor [Nitriliruptoraceae bacterium]